MIVLLALFAGCLFVQAFVRLRRRGRADHASWHRVALFFGGMVIGLAALLALDGIVDERLSGHMLQHVVLGDLVPALLVLAVRGPLLFFLLPAALLVPLSRSRTLRTLLGFLLRPEVAFTIWAVTLALWHVPALYDAVLARPLLHELEHAMFFLGGVLVWVQLIDPARRGRLSAWARLGYALVLFACGQALANVLLLSSGTLYPAYADFADQRRAAVVMMVEQLLTLGVFAAVMLRARLREEVVVAPDRHPFTA